jgi:hypothetical protein
VTTIDPGYTALFSHTPGVADAVCNIDRSDTVINVTTNIGSKTLRELLAFSFTPPFFMRLPASL